MNALEEYKMLEENILDTQVANIKEWVPRWQLAPKNTLKPYSPRVLCSKTDLRFEAYVSCASAQQPNYYFSVAVPLAAISSAMLLAATRQFWPEVGLDSSSEISGSTAAEINHVDFSRVLAGGPLFGKVTTDSRRHPLGDALQSKVLQFIALHEEGHYLNGHMDPKFGFSEKARNHECRRDATNRSYDQCLTDRALELDADYFAVVTMLGPVMAASVDPGAKRYLEQTQFPPARKPVMFTRLIATSYALAAALLWQAEGKPECLVGDKDSKRSHPTPFCRAVFFGRIASLFAANCLPSLKERELWDTRLNHDVRTILSVMGIPNEDIHFMHDGSTPWSRECHRTIERLLQIKPALREASLAARQQINMDPGLTLPPDVPGLLETFLLRD